MDKVWHSHVAWLAENPVRKVGSKPSSLEEDSNFESRLDADVHKCALENIIQKEFEVVEFENKFFVIEKGAA